MYAMHKNLAFIMQILKNLGYFKQITKIANIK